MPCRGIFVGPWFWQRGERVMRRVDLPELLAPAGGLAQLHAAVNNGADAVYLGGSRFNARGKAENFTLPRLRDAIAYAHERDVKIYVTFNTLLKDRELPEALDYAGALWDIGADAVIVQDMGLVHMLGKNLPELPLHMSTQGTITGKHAVELMKEFGIHRIVPARELPLEEIREMAEVCHSAGQADSGIRENRVASGRRVETCELEVFVHGALCMCYSGQCQMSRLLGASGGKGSVRSGNRGLCAQPCRLPYTDDQGRTGYFLSPKDLCLLEDIPALCEAGVDSLKVEGRLKSPEYVAVVTSIYRKYLDQYARTGKIQVSEEDRRDLTQIYNRGGFTKGYLYGNPGPKLLSGASPKNTGIYIGTVKSVVDPRNAGKDRAAAAGAAKKGAALVDVKLVSGKQQERLEEGDGVEFRRGEHVGGGQEECFGEGHRERPGTGTPAAAMEQRAPGGVVTFRRELAGGVRGGMLRIGDMKGEIAAGDRVYRVTQRALLERARESFDTEDPAELDRRMRYPLKLQMAFEGAVGQPAVLKIREHENCEMDSTKVRNIREIRVYSQDVLEVARNRAADPDRIRQQLAKLGGTPFAASPEEIRVLLDGRCVVPISQINKMRREGIDQLLQEKRRVDRLPADQDALAEVAQRLAGARLEEPAMPPGERIPLMEYMDMPEEEAVSGRFLPYIDAVSRGRLDTFIEEHFDEIAARLKDADCGILIRTNSWIRQFLDAGVAVYGGHGLNIYNEEARLAYEEMGVQVAELSHETGISADGRIPLMITEHEVQSKTLTDRKGQVHLVERSSAGDKTFIW